MPTKVASPTFQRGGGTITGRPGCRTHPCSSERACTCRPSAAYRSASAIRRARCLSASQASAVTWSSSRARIVYGAALPRCGRMIVKDRDYYRPLIVIPPAR